MGERLVGFGHTVHIVALLHGRAAALRCIPELGGKPLDHGLLATLTRVVGEPTHRERDAAVQAALKARFSPTKLSGQPVKVSGVINYKFALVP